MTRVSFSAAQEYAEEFFRNHDEAVDIRVPLRDLVGTTLRGGVHRPVKLRIRLKNDKQEQGRPHDALVIQWEAGTRFLPDFHGTLRLRIASVDETKLTLDGTYQPPFGPFGLVFDLPIGRRIARATMRDLLARLGDAMEQREAEFRAGDPAKP